MRKLPGSGTEDLDKKDIRIAFITNDDFKITDLKVYPCKDQLDRDTLHVMLRTFAYKDFGNSHSDWDEWDLLDVILGLFKYPVNDHDTVVEIFKELGKVKEWKDKLLDYNNRFSQ